MKEHQNTDGTAYSSGYADSTQQESVPCLPGMQRTAAHATWISECRAERPFLSLPARAAALSPCGHHEWPQAEDEVMAGSYRALSHADSIPML